MILLTTQCKIGPIAKLYKEKKCTAFIHSFVHLFLIFDCLSSLFYLYTGTYYSIHLFIN